MKKLGILVQYCDTRKDIPLFIKELSEFFEVVLFGSHSELKKVPLPRRQLLPLTFFREGSVYVIRRDTLMIEHTLYGAKVRGVEVDPTQSVNLDTMEDWSKAEKMLTTFTERHF